MKNVLLLILTIYIGFISHYLTVISQDIKKISQSMELIHATQKR